ncbi:MAG: chemotaxis protein CheW [Leptospiraceae bacterium]|jgi:purine-binding chemotaxis protein CheW|nr:chemotaxis protein CheW [Leptospiraceae bacterium]
MKETIDTQLDKESENRQFRETQFLVFESANNLYGIDILKITEILKPVQVTRLPNAENFVLGVINLRGNIVPVIDIRKILKNEYTELTNFSRIIVSNIYNKNLGLLVERVLEVVTLREDQIEGGEIKNFSENYIEGVGRSKDKLFLIFNLPLLVEQYKPKELNQTELEVYDR